MTEKEAREIFINLDFLGQSYAHVNQSKDNSHH